MRLTTYIRDTWRRNAKFQSGDKALVLRTFRDDSRPLKAHIGRVGIVLGRTDYQHHTPGNRYYLEFSDGYIGGYEPSLLKKIQ